MDEPIEGSRSITFATAGHDAPAGAELPLPSGFLARYRIDSLLGSGAMGVVYRATDLKLGRAVAVKFIARGDDTATARFLREARAMAAVSHPGVVAIHDFDEAAGHPYLVTEMVDGGTLAARLEKPWNPTDAASLMARIAEALAACHAADIVHRDLKPANILLTSAGAPKIADLGIARFRDDVALTRTGALIGTPRYMAPEQITGSTATAKTDVHACGLILFELLAGAVPYDAKSTGELCQVILTRPPPDVRALVPHASAELSALISECLAKVADQRPTAAELARRLAACAPLVAPPPEQPRTRSRKVTVASRPASAPRSGPARAPSGPVGAASQPGLAAPRGKLTGLFAASLLGVVALAIAVGLALRPAVAPRPPADALLSGWSDVRLLALDTRLADVVAEARPWTNGMFSTMAGLDQPGKPGAGRDSAERYIASLAPGRSRIDGIALEMDRLPESLAGSAFGRVLRLRAVYYQYLVRALARGAANALKVASRAADGGMMLMLQMRDVPLEPEEVALLRKTLAACPPALDAVGIAPSEAGRQLGLVLRDVGATFNSSSIFTDRSIGASGRAAIARLREDLVRGSAGPAAPLHRIALALHRIAFPHPGESEQALLASARSDLAALRSRAPAAVNHIDDVDARIARQQRFKPASVSPSTAR